MGMIDVGEVLGGCLIGMVMERMGMEGGRSMDMGLGLGDLGGMVGEVGLKGGLEKRIDGESGRGVEYVRLLTPYS